MKSPAEIEAYLAQNWFMCMDDAHEARNYIKEIYASRRFKFRYNWSRRIWTDNKTPITAQEAINFFKT